MTETTTETPRVWVGCLGCYNAGALVGEWVDATEADEITIERLHNSDTETRSHIFRSDPYAALHEELWVFDFEGFDGFLTSECSPTEAKKIADAIDELPDYVPAEAVAAFLANTGESLTDLNLEDFEESYCGEWQSGAEYAADLADQLSMLPDDASWPLNHIDWEGAWRDLSFDGYWTEDASGGVYIFRH